MFSTLCIRIDFLLFGLWLFLEHVENGVQFTDISQQTEPIRSIVSQMPRFHHMAAILTAANKTTTAMATVKRKATDVEKAASAPKKPFGHWSQGLLASMDDPELRVDADDKVVIIKDKYPKVHLCRKNTTKRPNFAIPLISIHCVYFSTWTVGKTSWRLSRLGCCLLLICDLRVKCASSVILLTSDDSPRLMCDFKSLKLERTSWDNVNLTVKLFLIGLSHYDCWILPSPLRNANGLNWLSSFIRIVCNWNLNHEVTMSQFFSGSWGGGGGDTWRIGTFHPCIHCRFKSS